MLHFLQKNKPPYYNPGSPDNHPVAPVKTNIKIFCKRLGAPMLLIIYSCYYTTYNSTSWPKILPTATIFLIISGSSTPAY